MYFKGSMKYYRRLDNLKNRGKKEKKNTKLKHLYMWTLRNAHYVLFEEVLKEVESCWNRGLSASNMLMTP